MQKTREGGGETKREREKERQSETDRERVRLSDTGRNSWRENACV